MNFVRRPQRFVILPLLARVASGTRFGTVPGSVWEPSGPQDASKTASRAHKTRPRAPKRPPRQLQERPRGLPDHPKKPPRPFQEAFRRPRSSKRPPGSHWGPILPPCWTPFGRKNHPPKVCRPLPGCQWRGTQQHCKTAVWQTSAGPATGAHAPTR